MSMLEHGLVDQLHVFWVVKVGSNKNTREVKPTIQQVVLNKGESGWEVSTYEYPKNSSKEGY